MRGHLNLHGLGLVELRLAVAYHLIRGTIEGTLCTDDLIRGTLRLRTDDLVRGKRSTDDLIRHARRPNRDGNELIIIVVVNHLASPHRLTSAHSADNRLRSYSAHEERRLIHL